MLSSHIWTGEKERKQHQQYFRHHFIFITVASKVGCRKQNVLITQGCCRLSFFNYYFFNDPAPTWCLSVGKTEVRGDGWGGPQGNTAAGFDSLNRTAFNTLLNQAVHLHAAGRPSIIPPTERARGHKTQDANLPFELLPVFVCAQAKILTCTMNAQFSLRGSR